MRDRIDLTSELPPNVILEKMVAEAGWRDGANKLVYPYDPGSHKVVVHVRRSRFKIAMSGKMRERVGGTMTGNSFAPVCVGRIEELSDGGSRIRARFRLIWFTRLFMIYGFGFIAFAIFTEAGDRYRHPSGYYSPAVEALLYGLGVAVLVSPLIGVMLWFIVGGSRLGHQREAMRELLIRVSSSSGRTTAAPPSTPAYSPPNP